jgi:hypothetical protein
MTDETAANPADEPITAPVADEVQSTEANTPAEGDEVADDFDDLIKEGLGDDSTPEELEVEYEGKTYKVSPELKDALLRQADYTRKTTEVAREREAVEAMRRDAEVYRNLGAATIEAAAQAKTLEGQIAQLESMSTHGLTQEQINGYNIQHMRLTEQKAAIDNDIRAMIEADRARSSEELTKFQQEAIEEARKSIPNFDDKRRQDLESFAVKLGVHADDVKTITDASAYKILHLADIGQKFLDRQRATKKVENAQSTSPAAEVGGKAVAAKDPNKMSTEEWMKHRQRQVAS